jgi:AraC-like DNA-binding protein
MTGFPGIREEVRQMLQHNPVEEMAAGLSLDQFNGQVGRLFFPMACEGSRERAFRGTLESHRLGQVGLAVVKSTPLDVHRRKSDIGQAADLVYMVKVQAKGESLVRHCGREAHLRPGDFTLCSSAEPYQLHFPGDYCQVVLAIPACVMEQCVRQPARYLGLRMDAGSGANGLFSQFLGSLASRFDAVDGVLAQRLEANVMDLLATTLEHTRDEQRRELQDCGVRYDYLQRIKAFIRRHLDDDCLAPDWIAQSHGISTRYLHMLFETESLSVSRYIQQLRLEACRAALADSAFGHYSVAEIAYRFGFKDPSHFSRVFKAGFGVTPAGFRKHCRAGGVAPCVASP